MKTRNTKKYTHTNKYAVGKLSIRYNRYRKKQVNTRQNDVYRNIYCKLLNLYTDRNHTFPVQSLAEQSSLPVRRSSAAATPDTNSKHVMEEVCARQNERTGGGDLSVPEM